MRLLTSASIGVLSLLLGIPAVSAQDDAKPRQEESKPEQGHQDEMKPPQTPADHDKQEMKQDQNHDLQNQAPKDEKQTKEEKQQQKDDAKAAKEAAKQGSHAQPVNGKSGHIPDDQFKAHFGRQHTVVINRPVIVEGQPRFQYSGYWFAFSDPWPVGWAYTDQCYIDYVDGEYFLFDLLHPGVRIALFVVVA